MFSGGRQAVPGTLRRLGESLPLASSLSLTLLVVVGKMCRQRTQGGRARRLAMPRGRTVSQDELAASLCLLALGSPP